MGLPARAAPSALADHPQHGPSRCLRLGILQVGQEGEAALLVLPRRPIARAPLPPTRAGQDEQERFDPNLDPMALG